MDEEGCSEYVTKDKDLSKLKARAGEIEQVRGEIPRKLCLGW
jgi:hypothetical protein